jgi:dipeptide/tripeptide permease
MIQRQQSLWLLLAAVASYFSMRHPFYTGTKIENNTSLPSELIAGSNPILLVLTILSVLLAVIAIFLYKDRKTQLKLAIAGIVLSAGILALYFAEIRKFERGNLALTCIFAIAILAGYIMAARGIRKDQQLIKSLDKLR